MMHKTPLIIAEIEAKNYHLFIELTVNNIPCRLLLDTGASKTVMDTDRVQAFVTNPKDIVAHHSKSVGLGTQDMETQVATLRNWRINQFEIRKFEVAVLPIAHVNQTYQQLNIPAIDGVLGSDFLMKYNAVIDYKKRILNLHKTKK
jgi:hypothetical protein